VIVQNVSSLFIILEDYKLAYLYVFRNFLDLGFFNDRFQENMYSRYDSGPTPLQSKAIPLILSNFSSDLIIRAPACSG
jgi:superfamily II DNA/RNA helicase